MLDQGDDDEYLVVSLAIGLILVGHNSRIHLGSRWWQRRARKVAVVGRGRPVDGHRHGRGRVDRARCRAPCNVSFVTSKRNNSTTRYVQNTLDPVFDVESDGELGSDSKLRRNGVFVTGKVTWGS